jgi:maltose alpha-D-glucosyltransferase/alpha-amylase
MKLVRRPDPGINPDLEIGRFLSETAHHVNSPRMAGSLEYHTPGAEPMTIGILREYVNNECDAWAYTLDALASYYEHVLSRSGTDVGRAAIPDTHLLELAHQETPALATETIGTFLQSAELLGKRTGELHVALASAADDPAFSPEPFTPFYQRSIFEGMRTLTAQVTPLLEKRRGNLPPHASALAGMVLSRSDDIIKRFRSVMDRPITGARVRVHGDYHLGQILFTGKDFVIVDFEGEPARPIGERRLKRSPMRDIAGMLRSLHYAAYVALHNLVAVGMIRQDQLDVMETWSRYWYVWSSASFLRGYLREATVPGVLPETSHQSAVLLDAYLMEKAVYEVGYELNNRPEWVHIPLAGILDLLGPPA